MYLMVHQYVQNESGYIKLEFLWIGNTNFIELRQNVHFGTPIPNIVVQGQVQH
jgi:hypothetical protein